MTHKQDVVSKFLIELEAQEAGLPSNIKKWLHGTLSYPKYDSTYRTPLHYMVLRGELDYVFERHEIYKRYAGIKDKSGRTALMYLLLNKDSHLSK